MPEDKERITILEVNYSNMANVIVELKDYMKNSSVSRAANHSEVIQRLSVIETKQDEFKAYQMVCDKERETISDDVMNLKLRESNQSGRANVWAIVTSTIVSGLIAILVSVYSRLK